MRAADRECCGAGRRKAIAAGLLALTLLSACAAPWRSEYSRQDSVAFAEAVTGTTLLARRVRALGDPGDGRSGVALVSDGPTALALRLGLTQRAERSIDAQYYLLHDDPSGHLFLGQLMRAADRGVRVRLLLDDMDAAAYDDALAALARHPKVQIRLFNPFPRGLARPVVTALEFLRVNRRMHNKSMTFDNVVTLVGGRNIGDEYFAAKDESNYTDLDLLAAGPLAAQVSAQFDAYWNSAKAVPVGAVSDRGIALAEAREALEARMDAALRTPFGAALAAGRRDWLPEGGAQLVWVPARLIADPVEKSSRKARGSQTVSGQILPYLTGAERELFVSSAYFVPRNRGVALLGGLAQRGVDVTVLTNSMDSTDVLSVYGHYALWRTPLLQRGVDLWELRADSARADRLRLGLEETQSSLHTKAFVVDRRYLFVGSFNWDPRSVFINTEMGILIDSPPLAGEAATLFQQHLQESAYRVRLDDEGTLRWQERRDAQTLVEYRGEPFVSHWRALLSRLYTLLPIGGQL
ncbi:phospholipase D family protein [Salipiger bermudensis]|uniref:phospholipase D family protein n=1 Tax=Salipiger bermudensis TaxID=344736 RepID=UPI001C992E9C|nr:phospholipase D family protein [Salipiger bermudensis]MBY6004737.1 phospholipase D family protein [Salipiger bermudensis]